jgi:hypothetical protein
MKSIFFSALLGVLSLGLMAQQFESPKSIEPFDKVRVKVGGDFALQFQGLDHSTENELEELVALEKNLNLPTANLNIDVQLAEGMKLHLRTYLSSRHHPEAWVKGGHLVMEDLNFIRQGFLSGAMKYLTIRVGLDEINYGDAHFRRTDNARATTNPFVGNYIMDAFATEAFGEIYFRERGLIAMLGLSNGRMNQSVLKSPTSEAGVSLYGKIGYDRKVTEDLRVRLTGSIYSNQADSRKYLYGGDRAGSRYYNVMQSTVVNNFSGRFDPGFRKLTAIQFNPFIKFKGAELFGVYEMANGSSGGTDDLKGSYTQTGVELLYRFGKDERFYLGGRYNQVSGHQNDDAGHRKIDRINAGGGWFLTPNVVTKLEYVQQTYSGEGWSGVFQGGQFNGIMVEAAISF